MPTDIEQDSARPIDTYFQSLIESAADLVVLHVVDGKVQYASPSVRSWLGFEPVELHGYLALELVDPADQTACTALFSGQSDGLPIQMIDLRMRHRDGSWQAMKGRSHRIDADAPHSGVVVMLRQSDSEVATAAAVVRDVAEQPKLASKIQHAQKLETLGVLAGGIAHDFNNLLMGVLGHAELAMFDAPPGSSLAQHLQQIQTAALRAGDLCKQMLAYSGKGKFIVRPLDLSVVVDELTDLLRLSVSRKARLQYDLAENLPAVEADAAQLSQVVMNLITNASDAVEDVPNATVTVHTGVMTADRAYLEHVFAEPQLPEGLYVYLEVKDNGVGMDEATRARMFDPFFTTKFTGRGLGMAAVLGIVRSHHGAIEVRSAPQTGTRVRVLFPPTPREPQNLTRAPKEVPQWQGSGSILLVDDEELIRTVGSLILEKLGFSVVTARDGQEAVELFAAEPEKFAIVLLDVTMPRMDGPSALVEMLAVRPEARIVLVSGYSEQEMFSRINPRGLAGYLQKPFKAGQLAAMLQAVLRG